MEENEKRKIFQDHLRKRNENLNQTCETNKKDLQILFRKADSYLKIIERNEKKQKISFDQFQDSPIERLQKRTLSETKPNNIYRLDKKEGDKS